MEEYHMVGSHKAKKRKAKKILSNTKMLADPKLIDFASLIWETPQVESRRYILKRDLLVIYAFTGREITYLLGKVGCAMLPS